MTKKIRILGTRGVPAAHGGFETFAHYLSLYLVKRGWEVVVYCQEDGRGPIREDYWEGVKRVNFPIHQTGPLGTIVFDWKTVRHAQKDKGLVLTLGYNTAIFNLLFRFSGIKNVINMDGIEWKRAKWGMVPKLWFYLNEIAGSFIGHRLIADHPSIADHLARTVSREKITMIPYGADVIDSGDEAALADLDLEKYGYALIVARPEPENSILEVVRAFSVKARGKKLVVLGNYEKENDYHQSILSAASDEVVFPGAIYDARIVFALRYFAVLYIHGHTVGGTNPSLVEALGCANAILAHDNKFNRWVIADAGLYFSSEAMCSNEFDRLLDDDILLRSLRESVRSRHRESFTWQMILKQYEDCLVDYV